jgi:hypothetical protein
VTLLGRGSLASGLIAAVGSVAVITIANYGLRELVPVVSTGVVVRPGEACHGSERQNYDG